MKQVKEMPTSGQFVMIFAGPTGLCADTLWWDEGKLESLMLSDSLDDEEIAALIENGNKIGAQYFIAD